MVETRRYSVGLLVLLGAVGSAGVAAAQANPEDVLAKRGLKKAGRFYIVATELEVEAGWRKIVPIYNGTEAAWNDLNQAWQAEAIVQQLDDTRINLIAYINDLNLQVNNASQIVRQPLQQEQQAAQRNLNAANGQLAIAMKQRVSDTKKEALRDEYMKRRAEFFEESNKLKPTFDKVIKEYEELKKDDTVVNAIRVLKERTKAPVFLGPSTKCREAFTQVKEAQKTFSDDPDSFRRRKKPKLKESPKAKARKQG